MIVISLISSLSSTVYNILPTGILHCIFSMFLVDGAYRNAWIQEFLGTMLMIGLTFSPGKWIGVDSTPLEWVCHALGVIFADYFAGGPHVNPAVSVAMFCLGKCSYTECYIRSMGSIAGGLISFPLFLQLSSMLSWKELGGPEYTLIDENDDASSGFLNEFMSVFLLLIAIFVLNFEVDFGTYHYWLKQTYTAIAIRYLIVVFGLTGPAMNPMLGTTWLLFKVKSGYISGMDHYFIYWSAPFLAALSASFCYVVYAGGKFMGCNVPFGPVKPVAKPSEKME